MSVPHRDQGRNYSAAAARRRLWIDNQTVVSARTILWLSSHDRSTNPRSIAMTVYMVERNLKGIPMSDLAAAQKAAIGTAQAYTAKGTPVRYIRSTFAPEDGRCMCLFEAASAADVKTLNDEAKLPYSRIVEALDLTP
jgi:hypothetical protein